MTMERSTPSLPPPPFNGIRLYVREEWTFALVSLCICSLVGRLQHGISRMATHKTHAPCPSLCPWPSLCPNPRGVEGAYIRTQSANLNDGAHKKLGCWEMICQRKSEDSSPTGPLNCPFPLPPLPTSYPVNLSILLLIWKILVTLC